MKLYNTLSRSVEEFKPISPPKVGMYTCGPTVYDYQHIGNFRTMTLSDVVHRVLEYNGFDVKTVRNVTDIDDKIIRKASEKNVPIEEYTKEYTEIFFQDLEKLNILPVDENTYATKYVDKMIAYIEDLVKKGFAYVERDGSVYFDISKLSDYGKLSQLDKANLKTGTRVLSDEYSKDDVQDFALWKATKEGEIQSYDSPWGKGRPGWHIECSVMSQDNLGDTFDIHVGGMDLIFPHHENEIAQSESKSGKQFVRYWIHGEFLNVDGGKMSKSLKNFYTIKDIEEKGINPLALRYLYFSAHYRTKLNFTWEALGGAQNSLARLKSKVGELKIESGQNDGNSDTAKYDQDFLEALNNDLNLPQAIAVVWELLEDKEIPALKKLAAILKFDKVLGLKLDSQDGSNEVEVPKEVKSLLAKRNQLRKEKKFAEADEVRDQIKKLGFDLEDSDGEQRVKKSIG